MCENSLQDTDQSCACTQNIAKFRSFVHLVLKNDFLSEGVNDRVIERTKMRIFFEGTFKQLDVCARLFGCILFQSGHHTHLFYIHLRKTHLVFFI